METNNHSLKAKFTFIFVRIVSYLYLPFDILLKQIFPRKIYKLIKLFIPIPISNYYKEKGVNQNFRNLMSCCIMDTFDRLGAKYDRPWTLSKLKQVAKNLRLSNYDIKVVTNNGNGLVLNGVAE